MSKGLFKNDKAPIEDFQQNPIIAGQNNSLGNPKTCQEEFKDSHKASPSKQHLSFNILNNDSMHDQNTAASQNLSLSPNEQPA